MKKFFFIAIFCLPLVALQAQPFKYYPSNHVKFLDGNSDTLSAAFAGGMRNPQFSNIDFNNDGVQDVFIFDRSGNKVLTFITVNDGGVNRLFYAPQYEEIFPALYRWALLVDYNQDGMQDVFTEVENSLQVFTSAGVRIMKAQRSNDDLSFKIMTKQLFEDDTSSNPLNIYVPFTDMPAITDVDGDGDIDIVSSAGDLAIFGFIQYYRNKTSNRSYDPDSLLFDFTDGCWGSIGEAIGFSGVVLGQTCNARFYDKNKTGDGAHALLLLDKDDDGDMDMLLGNTVYDNLVFVENGKADFNYPIDTMIAFDTIYPVGTQRAEVSINPAAYFVDVNADGKRDLIVAPNDPTASKTLNQVLYYENTGTDAIPQFEFRQHNFLQEHMIDLGSKAAPIFWDYDNDGLQDLILATKGDYALTNHRKDRLVLYRNLTDSLNPVFQIVDDDFLNISDRDLSDIMPTLGDLNGDQKPDLILGDQNGRLHYLENTTTGNTPTFNYITATYESIDVGANAAPQLIDLDRDGLLDLVIGENKGNLNYYRNTGSSTQPNFELETDSLGNIRVNDFQYQGVYENGVLVDSVLQYISFNAYSTPHFCDLNGDGDYELLVGANSGRIHLYTNIENNLLGTFTEVDSFTHSLYFNTEARADYGKRTVPYTAYLDGDTLADILVGNDRGGISLLTSQFRPEDYAVGIRKIYRPNYALTIYPNPTNDILYLEREDLTQTVKISLLNTLGAEVMSDKIWKGDNRFEWSTGHLPDGIYYVHVTSLSGQLLKTDKIIKVNY